MPKVQEVELQNYDRGTVASPTVAIANEQSSYHEYVMNPQIGDSCSFYQLSFLFDMGSGEDYKLSETTNIFKFYSEEVSSSSNTLLLTYRIDGSRLANHLTYSTSSQMKVEVCFSQKNGTDLCYNSVVLIHLACFEECRPTLRIESSYLSIWPPNLAVEVSISKNPCPHYSFTVALQRNNLTVLEFATYYGFKSVSKYPVKTLDKCSFTITDNYGSYSYKYCSDYSYYHYYNPDESYHFFKGNYDVYYYTIVSIVLLIVILLLPYLILSFPCFNKSNTQPTQIDPDYVPPPSTRPMVESFNLQTQNVFKLPKQSTPIGGENTTLREGSSHSKTNDEMYAINNNQSGTENDESDNKNTNGLYN